MVIDGALYIEHCISILKPLPKKQITTTASEERLLRNPPGLPGTGCTDVGTITTIINSKKIERKNPTEKNVYINDK